MLDITPYLPEPTDYPIVVGPTPPPTPEPPPPAPVIWVGKPSDGIPSASDINRGNTSSAERQLTVAAENAPLRLIYGEVRVGAMIANVLVHGSYVVAQLVWGLGCEGVQSITLSNEDLPTGCTVNHYDGTQVAADSLLVDAFAAQSSPITYEDILPGVCYSVVKIPATKVDSGLEFHAVVRGRRVYDPREVGHDPDDDSTWEYSTNPSLCLADFLASATYGAGKTVDWTSVEACADWNDTLLGGEAHRRLDGWSLESVTQTRSVMETLRAYASVFLRHIGATVYFAEDKASSSVATYSHASGNIYKLDRLEKRDLGNNPTVVEVIYTDASTTTWRDRTATASLAGVGTTLPRRLSTVRLNGIHRHAQAYREAVERLNKLSGSDLTAMLTVFDDGMGLEVGDVITVIYPIGLTGNDFRLTAPPENVGDGLWRLQLEEYNPSSYSTAINDGTTYDDTDLPDPSSPPAVTVTAVEELYRTESGFYGVRARLTISHDAFLWVERYEVELWDGATLVDASMTQQTSYASAPLAEGKSYTAKVRIVSTVGSFGTWGQDSFTAYGKIIPPTDVSEITGYEVGGDVYLSWTAAVDTDIWRYELRHGTTGATWETAELLDRVDSLRYVSKGVFPAGDREIFVKAIDSVGNYSASAASVTISVSIDPDALQSEVFPDTPTLTNMTNFAERGGSSFDITVVGKASFASTFGSALSNYAQPVSAYWGGGGTSTSSWESENDDWWGFTLIGDWNFDSDHSAVGTGTYVEALRLGTDGTNFTDYSTLPTKQGARYAHILLSSTDCLKVDRDTQRIYVNAQTRTEYGVAEVTSTGTPGARVYLSGEYFARRNVLLTPVGTSAGLSAVVDNVTLGTGTNYFDIYAFDMNNNRVDCDVDYRFEGI